MDPYPFKGGAVCYVCGEPGDARPRDVWSANVRHTYPEVCAANLDRKRQELDKREADLVEREAS